MPRKPAAKPKKLYVLDTNVLLHDPYCVYKFEEQDIYVPFVTLEELDNKKSGRDDLNRNARQATRLLDEVVSQPTGDMKKGYFLEGPSAGQAKGKLFVQCQSLEFLPQEHHRKNDNLFLAVLDHLAKSTSYKNVILVTKDLNLRIKARAMGFEAEDYKHDHAVEDADLIYRGWRDISQAEYDSWAEFMAFERDGAATRMRVPLKDAVPNEFLLMPTGELYQVVDVNAATGVCTLRSCTDYEKSKNAVLGVTSRNIEQRAALNLLMDKNVDMVALLGPAGSGKTLLALAAALHQVQNNTFESIIVTRATTPLGEEIGFLPGDENEKMAPWMGAVFDNLEVLAEAQAKEGPDRAQRLKDLAEEKVSLRAMTFMRGRSFNNRVLILDEAQNLTPEQVKALVTRMGENSKLVLMGNLAQIDSPYLSESSSGLAYLVEKFKGWEHFGSLVLDRGERSRLASEANKRL